MHEFVSDLSSASPSPRLLGAVVLGALIRVLHCSQDWSCDKMLITNTAGRREWHLNWGSCLTDLSKQASLRRLNEDLPPSGPLTEMVGPSSIARRSIFPSQTFTKSRARKVAWLGLCAGGSTVAMRIRGCHPAMERL